MKYRDYIITAIITFVITLLAAWWVYATYLKEPPVNNAVSATNTAVQELTSEIKNLKEQLNAREERTRKEVYDLHENIKKGVSALSSDDVAVELNAELSEFRRLQVSP